MKSYKETILVLVPALFDVVTDFFFTNAGNLSPVAIPKVQTVDGLLGSGGSSSGRSGVLETSSFSGGEESKEDEQADKDSLHFYGMLFLFLLYSTSFWAVFIMNEANKNHLPIKNSWGKIPKNRIFDLIRETLTAMN